MKGGMVAQIRVNPKDCLAVLDIMESLGINVYDGRSFASCVSVALSSLIGVARQGGIIKSEEEEDGFEWSNRMDHFRGRAQKNDKRKKMITDSLYDRARHGLSAPALQDLNTSSSEAASSYSGYRGGVKSEGIDSLSADLSEEDKDRMFLEYKELNEKMNSPDVDPEDRMRYRELGKMLGCE